MGASESIHNDYFQPVTVWWQLGKDKEQVQVLRPGATARSHKVNARLRHSVCVGIEDRAVCMRAQSPSEASGRTYTVRDILAHESFTLPRSVHTEFPVEYILPALLGLGALGLAMIGIKKARSSNQPAYPTSPVAGVPRTALKQTSSSRSCQEALVQPLMPGDVPESPVPKSSVARQVVVIAPAKEAVTRHPLRRAAEIFCNFFAVWLTIAAIVALAVPDSFTWIPDDTFTGLLGLLMFCAGITSTVDDFKKTLTKPVVVGVSFLLCYGIMPGLAYATGRLMEAEGSIFTGLVLVGAINGGQASNLCTLIAGGDVALSVLMTTSSTLGCIMMTPLICELVLGRVVPVNSVGIVKSCFKVVLLPIFLGVGFNTLAPRVTRRLSLYTPVAGVICTVLLVGAAVAKSATPIIDAGITLQVACLNLHAVGGIIGYYTMAGMSFNQKTCRTVAIQTSMKSSAFAFVLASRNFGAFNVRVPAAVSVVWMAITGSCMAIYWKFNPVTDVTAGSTRWSGSYGNILPLFDAKRKRLGRRLSEEGEDELDLTDAETLWRRASTM